MSFNYTWLLGWFWISNSYPHWGWQMVLRDQGLWHQSGQLLAWQGTWTWLKGQRGCFDIILISSMICSWKFHWKVWICQHCGIQTIMWYMIYRRVPKNSAGVCFQKPHPNSIQTFLNTKQTCILCILYDVSAVQYQLVAGIWEAVL